jgi:hypothetical protein
MEAAFASGMGDVGVDFSCYLAHYSHKGMMIEDFFHKKHIVFLFALQYYTA